MSGAHRLRAHCPLGTARRFTAMVVLAAALLLPAGVAWAQQPTLQFDRPAYTDDEQMRFSGAGYTPSGEVNLLFALPMDPRGMFTTQADATGALDDYVVVGDADEFLEDDEERETIFVSANDQTRIDTDQQPPESRFGVAQFTFTRWLGFSPGRYVPGKRVQVEVFGWTFAVGETAWFQFRKGSRVVAAVKVGRLEETFGDRKAKVRVPRGLKPGKYRVVLSTMPRGLSDRFTWRWGRVTGAKAAVAAASRDTSAMVAVNRVPGLPPTF